MDEMIVCTDSGAAVGADSKLPLNGA